MRKENIIECGSVQGKKFLFDKVHFGGYAIDDGETIVFPEIDVLHINEKQLKAMIEKIESTGKNVQFYMPNRRLESFLLKLEFIRVKKFIPFWGKIDVFERIF